MPRDRSQARKILSDIGMDFKSYHACPNDCILYRHEYTDMLECPKCGKSRYRQDVQGEQVPAKVLRHFSHNSSYTYNVQVQTHGGVDVLAQGTQIN